MDKVAMYKVYIEKIASRAWKKHLGELSEESRKILESKGILNYKKEIDGLNQGTKNIAKRYGATIGMPSSEEMAEKGFKSLEDNPLHYNRGSSYFRKMGYSDDQIAQLAKGSIYGAHKSGGGYYTMTSPNPKHRMISIGNIDNEGSAVPMLAKGKIPKDGTMERNYLDAVMARHEADEMRFGTKAYDTKGKHISSPKEKGKIMLTDMNTHMSPKVLGAESANVAVAPKSVRDTMNTIRENGHNEAITLAAHGLDYGSSGVYNKRLNNKMERHYIAENRKNI